RARGVRLCVVDLAPRVFARFIGEAAQLSEAIQRWTDRPVRELLRRQLMTRIAVGSRRALRIVGELESLAALRDLLAALPVADEVAVGRIADRREVRLLDLLGDRSGQRPVRKFAA